MNSIHHSNFGGLLNRPTAELVANYRYLHGRVREIDECGHFVDGYAYECARNDRADYRKRLNDLSQEINSRVMFPEASLRVIRNQEITARVREMYLLRRKLAEA